MRFENFSSSGPRIFQIREHYCDTSSTGTYRIMASNTQMTFQRKTHFRYNIFAGCHSITCQGAKELEVYSERIEVMHIDVSSDESVKSARVHIEAKLGETGETNSSDRQPLHRCTVDSLFLIRIVSIRNTSFVDIFTGMRLTYTLPSRECAGKLWAVVANAGVANQGPLEWTSMSEIEHIFQVNTFGVLRTVKEFLPSIRKTKGA